MKDQNYYANFPTKLLQENFKNGEDLKNHLAAMGLIVSFVNTETGEFYLSRKYLSERLEITEQQARRIIQNLIDWGYIVKVKVKKGRKGNTIYRLVTYNFSSNSEPILEPISEPIFNKENQGLEAQSQPISEPILEPQTNNKITNNEITNNENKEEEKVVSGGGDFEIENEELVNEVELKKEIDHLIAIYPKKIANFTRLNERYFRLRIYHALSFKHIKEAVENYMLENDGTDPKFLKNLDNLLVYEELHPFLFKPVIAIDKEGNRIEGEFCISSKAFRFKTPEGIKQVVFDNKKFEEMIEQGRLIFRQVEQVACVN